MESLAGKRIVLTGGAGFLGKQVHKSLRAHGADDVFVVRKAQHDLRDPAACAEVTRGADIVVHGAANVGGIGYNLGHPGELFYDNAMMGLQLMEAARRANVKKFVSLGTICAYPKFTPVPFREATIWDGYPEETNAPYGLAKKMLLVQGQAYRQQYGFNAIYLLPVNLYGPDDNFGERSHVMPALIEKIAHAKQQNAKEVTVWGDGSPTREFLYVEDAGEGVALATLRYDKPEPVNLGSGMEISIADLVGLLTKIMGFEGRVVWDKTKPNGQPRRSLDTSRANTEFGFVARTPFEEGLRRTVDWYLHQEKSPAVHATR